MKAEVINIREENNPLYPIFADWWKAHGWPAVPLEILPKCGILVQKETGEQVVVGWLYMDNSVGVSMLEWVVSNPAATAKEIYVGITYLIKSAKEIAVALDYGVMLTSTSHPGLIKSYERNGFKKTDSGMTHMLLLTR